MIVKTNKKVSWVVLLRKQCSLKKEVIQPQVLLRLPCYDFTPLAGNTLGNKVDFGCHLLGWCDGRCVQGPSTYSPRCG